MKWVSILSVLLIWAIFCSGQTTYYYDGSGNLNATTNWWTNTNGTGSNPINFTTNNQYFEIQNGQSPTNAAAWSISGNPTRLIIKSGATLTATTAVTLSSNTTFIIESTGTYIHSNATATSSSIFQGIESFNINSTIQINNWSSVNTTPFNAMTASVSSGGNNYFYGNLIINWTGNTGSWDWGLNNNTVNLAGGNVTVNSTGSGAGRIIFATNNKDFIINILGSFTMAGGYIDYSDANGGGSGVRQLRVGGNVSHTSGTLTVTSGGSNGAGQIVSASIGSGINDWSFTGGTRAQLAYLVESPRTTRLISNLDCGTGLLSWSVQVASGATLDAQTFTISHQTAGGNVYLNGGTTRTSNLNGLFRATNTTINSTNLTFTHVTNSTVEYYATGNQTVTWSALYENVIINGTGTKQLQDNTTINKTLTFSTAGSGINKLDIAAYTLTIASTGSIANASTDRYVITIPTSATNGRLRQNGLAAAARVFPVGTTANYLPVTITPAAVGTDFSISVFRSTTTNGLPGGPDYSYRVHQVDAVYRIDRAVGSSNAQIRFDWQTNAIEGSVFTGVADTQIGIWVRKSNWILATVPSTNFIASNTTNFANTNGTLSDFGTAGTGYPYIVANITTLPFRFIKLDITKTNNGSGYLEWQLDNESNVNYYEVEESADGITFTKLSKIYADGSKVYRYTDQILNEGANYYRVKAVGKEGENVYSAVVAVNNKLTATLQLLNNPVVSQLIFKHPAAVNAKYRITDLMGRTVMSGRITPNAVITQIDMIKLASGTYILHYTDSGEQIVNQFIRN